MAIIADRHWSKRLSCTASPKAIATLRSTVRRVYFAFIVVMALSAAPSPLYPIYQHVDGFSTFTVTVVFADGAREEIARAPKAEVAERLWSLLAPRLPIKAAAPHAAIRMLPRGKKS